MRRLGLKKNSQHAIVICAMLCQLLLSDVLIMFAQLIQVCHQDGLHISLLLLHVKKELCALGAGNSGSSEYTPTTKQLPSIDFNDSKHGLRIVITAVIF